MDGAFVIFVIFNCWSVILQIFEFQKCPFQGDCPQRGERLTMRTGKSWTHCVYCHNAWAFYWLLLSLYLSGLRWLEVPSHTQLASFIKLLVDLSLKFNIWRKKIRGWSSWRIPWMVGSFSSYDRQVIFLTTSSSAIFMRPAAAGKDTQFFKWNGSGDRHWVNPDVFDPVKLHRCSPGTTRLIWWRWFRKRMPPHGEHWTWSGTF